MKKIIMLLIISIFTLTLVACNEQEERNITFNISHGKEFTVYQGEPVFDISSVTATDHDGMNLSPFIEIVGDYDLNIVGDYSLQLFVQDNFEVSMTVNIVLHVVELTCEMDDTQDKCKILVTGIEFLPVTNDITFVYVDEFVKLLWNILPSDASNDGITILSSNDDIATVNSYGYVFGQSEGTVTISITTNDGEFEITKTIDVLSKSCDIDPLQDKCYEAILEDQTRLVTLDDSNLTGTDYNLVYVNNRIYYEIYVRTFADSNNNNIGDFQGIIDNLAYLKSLGVSGIWLMPITDSSSDHGYNVDDYFDVDSEYGSMTDFRELVSAAEGLGIDIIIDLVINHMGAFNDIFQNVLQNGTNSIYYDWFTWVDSDDPRAELRGSWGQVIWYNPTGRNWLRDGSYTIHSSLSDKLYCGYFSDWMPDLNVENPEVVEYLKSVGEFWLDDVGIKGFRMDAVAHLYGFNEHEGIFNTHDKNIEFLTEYINYLETINTDVYVVVEAWESYQTYAEYYEADLSAFNFQAKYYTIDAVNGYLSNDIGSSLNQIYKEISKYNPDFIDAVFISNHDMDRVAKAVGDDIDTRLAAEILLTLPGNPYIYFGDEIGIMGTRTNMVWGDYYDTMYTSSEDRNVASVTEQLINPESLLNAYITLGSVRTNSLALMYGDFTPYTNNLLEGYFRSFENGNDKELVIVLFNFTSTYTLPIPDDFTSYEILYSSYENNYGGIEPNGVVILKLPYELIDTLIN